jgi:hypothetical protein
MTLQAGKTLPQLERTFMSKKTQELQSSLGSPGAGRSSSLLKLDGARASPTKASLPPLARHGTAGGATVASAGLTVGLMVASPLSCLALCSYGNGVTGSWCSILMWLTSLAIGPLWHSQAEAEASGRVVACEYSSPTLPVGPWGMVVVVVEALGYGCSSPTLPLGPWGMAVVVALSSELSLVVLSFMFVEHEAPGGSEQCHSILV